MEPELCRRRRRGVILRRGLLVGGAFVAIVLSGCAPALVPGGEVSHGRGPATILINTGSGDTFTPSRPGRFDHVLTYAQALTVFKTDNPQFKLDRHLTYQFGTLIQRPDDQDAMRPGTAVWALTWHECPQSNGPLHATPATGCVDWLFLNARTGHMIVWEFHVNGSAPPNARTVRSATRPDAATHRSH